MDRPVAAAGRGGVLVGRNCRATTSQSLRSPSCFHPKPFRGIWDPDSEGNLANAVSAIFLLITALLAFANALRSFGRLRTQDVSRRGAVPQAHGWIATGGWTTLAVTATFLAWEEIFEFKAAAGMSALGQMVLGTAYDGTLWPVVVESPDSCVRAGDGCFRRQRAPFDRFDRLTASKLRTGGPRATGSRPRRMAAGRCA